MAYYVTYINVVEVKGGKESPDDEGRKFYQSINDANQELFSRCENSSTLSFIIQWYLLKFLHG